MKLTNVKFIIIHCSATPRGRKVKAEDIRRWHTSCGFSDIGYQFIVGLDGEIDEGRPLDTAGAHCRGYNNCSIGVCYVGGLETDGVTPADTRTEQQKKALKWLVRKQREQFPQAEIRGHRDFAAKACPCFEAKELLEETV